MSEVIVESAGDYSRGRCNSHDSVRSFAILKSVDAHGIMAVEDSDEVADLFTVLLGNLDMLHRQPLNENGQRRLVWAKDAARQLCDFFSHGNP